MNLTNTNITGTIYINKDKLSDTQKFCEYYRCSIHETDKVARYQNIFPSMPPSNPIPFESYSEEPVYSIQITKGMLQDLIEHTNRMIEETELRSKDPRLMKMYSEYKTIMGLLR